MLVIDHQYVGTFLIAHPIQSWPRHLKYPDLIYHRTLYVLYSPRSNCHLNNY